MRAAAILLCAVTTSSCAFRPQLERVAVDHNEIVANTANQLVLLNILRARDRQPLHFTSVIRMFGDAQVTGTIGANVVARGGTPTRETAAVGDLVKTTTLGGTDVTTPSFSLGLNGRSSMDVAVYDSQEFYQGLTTSVPAGTLAHYIHQGWSEELLTYLFVSSVDFVVSAKVADVPALKSSYKPEQLVESYVNDPDDESLAAPFRRFVNCYRLTVRPKAVADHRLVRLEDVRDVKLADLALLDGEKFDVDDVNEKSVGTAERWIRRKGRTSDALGLRRLDAATEAKAAVRCGTDEAGVPQATAKRSAATFAIDRDPTGFKGEGVLPVDLPSDADHNIIATGVLTKGTDKIPVDVQVVLRSIDSVIYFLGEYIRTKKPNYLLYVNSKTYVPIINVEESRSSRPFVTARFGGKRYYIPAGEEGEPTGATGRSSQVIALVQQLINLQKTAKERPTTQTVRVVQ